MKETVYTKYSNERDDKFKIKTLIVRNDDQSLSVEKHPLTPQAASHIQNVSNYAQELSYCTHNTKFHINKCELRENYAVFEYLDGQTLTDILTKQIQAQDYAGALGTIQAFYKELDSMATEQFVPTSDFETVFGTVHFDRTLKSCPITNIDMIFDNIIVNETGWNVIDYEWTFLFPVPLDFVLYRAVVNSKPNIRAALEEIGIFKLFGVRDTELVQYRNMDEKFYSYVGGNVTPLCNLQDMQKILPFDQLLLREQDVQQDYFDVFYDTGSGFNHEEREVFPLSQTEINSVCIRVKNADKPLRLDPGNHPCVVNLLMLQENHMDLHFTHNGTEIEPKRILFQTNDPQLVIYGAAEKVEVAFYVQQIMDETASVFDRVVKERHDFAMRESRGNAVIGGLRKDLAELQANHQEKYLELETRHQNELRGAEERWEVRESDYIEQIRKTKKELHTVQLEYIQSLEEAEQIHQKSLDALKTQYENRIQRKVEQEEALREELLRFKQESESVHFLLMQEKKEREQEAAQLKQEIADALQVLEQEKEELKQKNADALHALEQEKEDLKQEHAYTIKTLEQEKEELKQKNADALHALEQEKEDLKQEHACTIKTLEQEKEELKQKNANALQALKQEKEDLEQKNADALHALEQEKDELNQGKIGVEQELAHCKEHYFAAVHERDALREEIVQLQVMYDTISNAGFWKMTAPLRFCVDQIKVFKNVLLSILKRKAPAVDVVTQANVLHSLDCNTYSDSILNIQGWIFSPEYKIKNLNLALYSNGKEYTLDILSGFEREDVYQCFQHENSRYSGFKVQAIAENLGVADVFLRWNTDSGHEEKISVGTYDTRVKNAANSLLKRINKRNIQKFFQYLKQGRMDLIDAAIHKPRFEAVLEEEMTWVYFQNFAQQYLNQENSKTYSTKNLECVDIIVPIYNGYQYFDALFSSVTKTGVPYRLIVVDDCSPDVRVKKYLEKLARRDSRVHLLKNSKNLGFVQTVNKALKQTKGHVVLLNSDVELPDKWLERLIAPILLDSSVASVTPFSNCATICSFPNFCQDNLLFEGLDCSVIDAQFQSIVPSYTQMPTGVGFCMAMSRAAIDQVGLLDAESFSKGYGEENDWCQRAIKCGYKNVMAENIFAYHKHGGSFLSEEKQRLLEENSKKLLAKHPNYDRDVAEFCRMDPVRPVREYIAMKLLLHAAGVKMWLAFDHALGGGATAYIENKSKQALQNGLATMIARYDVHRGVFRVQFKYGDYDIKYLFTQVDELCAFLEDLQIDTIYINELVTYPGLYDWFDRIVALKNKVQAKLVFLAHDYYAICPMINLVNERDKYCALPSDLSVCERCAKANMRNQYPAYESIKSWREKWRAFLHQCEEVIAFSNDTKENLETVFGKLKNLCVIPHQVNYIPPFEKKYKTTDTINIGLLGTIGFHKGADILKDLVSLVEQQGNYRIVVIGDTDVASNSEYFHKTGRYQVEDLTHLVLKHDIDVVLIPSIWPETFSYTTSEAIQMGLPVAVFNLGAPAERVKKYDKGIIIPEMTAESVLESIHKFMERKKPLSKRTHRRHILFVAEYFSFASRYRAEHCMESLLLEGVTSELVLAEELKNIHDLSEYTDVVFYRCPYTVVIGEFIKKCKDNKIPIFFNVDDLIFDYDAIKNFSCFQTEEYRELKTHCEQMAKTMQLCDKFITSTQSLKGAIEKFIPEKPVFVDRNVASLEMAALSLLAVSGESKSSKVKLGYFSGSKTHDEDFNSIKPALLHVLEKYPNVELCLVGCVQPEAEFQKYSSRITYKGFMDWRKLPGELAQIDINLMPLQDSFFNSCKSENKWMEAGLVHVPTIASWNVELARCITDGIDGVLCRDSKEWTKRLEELVKDAAMRKKLGDAAFKTVMRNKTVLNTDTVREYFELKKE